MVAKEVLNSIKLYLGELKRIGIPVHSGVLFGSFAKQTNSKWSDIDLIILSSLYDKKYNRDDINTLWQAAAKIDNRIEPIPVGLKRWETDGESTIIEVARREGITISL